MMKRFLVLLVLGLGFGCSHGEESECSKYVSLLGGTDPKEALENIAEKKCQDAVPIMKDMFDPRQGKFNKEIIRVLTRIWAPNPDEFKTEAEKFEKKKPLYVELLRLALQSPDTASLAAANIAEWKLLELKPDLLKMMREDVKTAQPQFSSAYAPALRLLAADEMGLSEDLEDMLIGLANNTPDIQGIEVNKLAVEGLGKLKTKNPEGIKALVRGLFLVAKDGGTTFKESVKSLLQVGQAATPFLLDIMESKPGDEKVRYMEEFAVKNAISEWKWRKGMRVPMVLAQLRDTRAAGAMLRDIARPVIEPANLPDALKLDWTIEMTNSLKFDSWGIMSVATPEIMTEALKIIRDRNVEGSARLQLALGLAFNFTPASMETLLKVSYEAQVDVEEEDTDEAKAAAKPSLGEVAKESDFVIRFVQPLAYGLDAAHLEQFNDIFVDGFDENFGDVEKSEDIQERLDQIDIKVLIAVSGACKDNVTCLLTVFEGGPGKVEGNSVVYDPDTVKGIDDRETEYVKAMARAKAALHLGRFAGKKEERAEILKSFGKTYAALAYDDELYGDLRQIILLGMERQGMANTAGAAAMLRDLIASEDKKNVESVKVWNQRLEALLYFIEAYKG
jgi:hypothetical protein